MKKEKKRKEKRNAKLNGTPERYLAPAWPPFPREQAVTSWGWGKSLNRWTKNVERPRRVPIHHELDGVFGKRQKAKGKRKKAWVLRIEAWTAMHGNGDMGGTREQQLALVYTAPCAVLLLCCSQTCFLSFVFVYALRQRDNKARCAAAS